MNQILFHFKGGDQARCQKHIVKVFEECTNEFMIGFSGGIVDLFLLLNFICIYGKKLAHDKYVWGDKCLFSLSTI